MSRSRALDDRELKRTRAVRGSSDHSLSLPNRTGNDTERGISFFCVCFPGVLKSPPKHTLHTVGIAAPRKRSPRPSRLVTRFARSPRVASALATRGAAAAPDCPAGFFSERAAASGDGQNARVSFGTRLNFFMRVWLRRCWVL